MKSFKHILQDSHVQASANASFPRIKSYEDQFSMGRTQSPPRLGLTRMCEHQLSIINILLRPPKEERSDTQNKQTER